MPGARCTRGLVCKCTSKKRTRAYRFSGEHPTSPAQWLYGLWRDLLGDEFLFVTVAAGLKAETIRMDRLRHRRLGISNGCRNHTLLPYAARLRQTLRRYLLPDKAPYQAGFSAVRLHAAHRLRASPPCNRLARRRCRVHRISTHVRDD